MNKNCLEQARQFLEEGYTCALVKGEQVLLSQERGVTPLLAWLDTHADCAAAVAADKVVGKAAAFLYVLLGVAFVHANVISEAAAQVFQRFGIGYGYGEQVSAIRNRKGDRFCPMEQAVWGIEEPQTAMERIRETLQKVNKH